MNIQWHNKCNLCTNYFSTPSLLPVPFIHQGTSRALFRLSGAHICLLDHFMQAEGSLHLRYLLLTLHLVHPPLWPAAAVQSHSIMQSIHPWHMKVSVWLWWSQGRLKPVIIQIATPPIMSQSMTSFGECHHKPPCMLTRMLLHLTTMLLQTRWGGLPRETQEDFMMVRPTSHIWLTVYHSSY